MVHILKSYKLSIDPLKIFMALSQRRHCFFLDSSLTKSPLARYSIFGIEPFSVLTSKGELPYGALREKLRDYKVFPSQPGLPFWGGAVGFVSYDLDCFFGFYNSAVILDLKAKKLHVLSLGFPEKKTYLAQKLAEKNFKRLENLLAPLEAGHRRFPTDAFGVLPLMGPRPVRLTSNFSKHQYLEAVKKVKEHIRRGDIYQLNLSQQFRAKTALSAQEIYLGLRKASPAPFSAYFDAGPFQVISSSPESFLRLTGRSVITRPMKGTRERSPDKAKDLKLKSALLKSAKDKAELMMIVDLERNDLGRVCSYGSVRVPRIRGLEKYRTVFQTTATVRGKLHQNKDRLDLLAASFPGGSITGCPKIRAMQIIKELEPSQRGIYTGSLGFLSFCGKMDFNILIRTILKKQDEVYFGSGGGIVADSDPEAEYEETLVKARAMMQAIGAR